MIMKAGSGAAPTMIMMLKDIRGRWGLHWLSRDALGVGLGRPKGSGAGVAAEVSVE